MASVTGPFELAKRRLIVQSPQVAVIFRNGVPWGVEGPGRKGPFVGGLPLTGEITYMLFDPAPYTESVEVPDLRLADGGRVAVTVQVHVVPNWGSDDAALLELAKTYGTQATRYIQASDVDLRSALQAELRRALSHLDHGLVTTREDARDLISVGKISGALVTVQRVLSLTVKRDPHFDTIEDVHRTAELERARLEVEQTLLTVRHTLETVRVQFESAVERHRRLSSAETDSIVANIYGVLPWAVAHPEFEASARGVREQMFASLVTEYADVLPYMAQQFGLPVADLLGKLVSDPGALTGAMAQPTPTTSGTLGASASLPASANYRLDEIVLDLQRTVPELRVFPSAGAGLLWPQSAQTKLVVAALFDGPGESRVFDLSDVQLQTLDLLVATVVAVPRATDPMDVVASVLLNALPTVGVVVADVTVPPVGAPGDVVVAVHETEPEIGLQRAREGVGAWVDALTALLPPGVATFQVA